MTRFAHQLEAITRQAEIECLHQLAGSKFQRHECVAEDANDKTCDDYATAAMARSGFRAATSFSWRYVA